MATLISSAVGGRKAAPKAPPRRRAAPASTSEPSHTPAENNQSVNTSAPSTSEESGTPQVRIDALASSIHEPSQRPAPSPPAVVERPVSTIQNDIPNEHTPVTETTASLEDQQQEPDPRLIVDPNVQHDSLRPASPSRPIDPVILTDQPTNTQSSQVRTRKRSRGSDAVATEIPSRKAPKRSSTRSSNAVQSEQAGPPSTVPPPNDTSSADAASSATELLQSAQGPAPSSASRPKRQKRPPKSRRTTDAVEGALESASETQSGRPNEEQSTSLPDQANVSKSGRRSRRAKRPAIPDQPSTAEEVEGANLVAEEDVDSDPESHRIDPATLSMYDLSHDTRHGKTSEREKKMAQIDWTAVARKRREEAEAILRGDKQRAQDSQNVVQSTEGADGAAASQTNDNDANPTNDDDNATPDAPAEQFETRAIGGGVRFRVVGGQIVEDEASLTIDRAARVAEAAAQHAEDPVEEENDLTVRFNRTTYINDRKRDETERLPLWKSKSDAWTEDETDRFYDALGMFGTDFFIISKMFPPKTRRQIKLKFVREERLDAERVNNSLLGKKTTKTFDLDHYAQAINRDVEDFHKYDGLDHANEVIKASMKDQEEEYRANAKEQEENTRQREVQRQQREKQREASEKKKEQKARKAALKKRGETWGAGTLGAADDDDAGAE